MPTQPETSKIVHLKRPLRIKTNKDMRNREHLYDDEVTGLIKTLRKKSRDADRDVLMVLMMYKHALRVSELIALEWRQIDLERGMLQVNRLKGGIDSTQWLAPEEMRLLRKLERKNNNQRYVFVSMYKTPVTSGCVRTMVRRAGISSGLKFLIHPHMFRHSCGYRLVNTGCDIRVIQQYMGHANINNTVLYTKLNCNALKGCEE